MRSPQKSNRPRGRGNRKSSGNNVNRVYESAGPEGKVRGTPQQIFEKYLTLARDAQTSGDRVVAENFLQHAEHYQRILIQANAQAQAQQQQSQQERQANAENANKQSEPEPQEAGAPQPDLAGVQGLTTIDAGKPESDGLLVAEDEMSTSQPSKPRRNGRDRGKSEETAETETQPEN
ncbi:MAG: DUF4167 domain-containing protein [Pseudomonadota bacterium]